MTINGFNIKKYRARVKDRFANTTSTEPVSEDGYKIVEGYISIANVIMLDEEVEKPIFVPVFVSEEIDFSRMAIIGFGKSVFYPMIYGGGEFEIIGEVGENE